MEQGIMNFELDDKNVITMKLLHYFITEKNYNPIILQGVDNEIWLENMKEDYKIVRIVSNYIHNNEQFSFDMFKTKRIVKKISKKTFSFNINTLSIFLSLGDNVDMSSSKNLECIMINNENDLNSSNILKNIFPDITNKTNFKEDGMQLFMKITSDINKHNKTDAEKLDEVFKKKFPIVTFFLVIINVLAFLLPIAFEVYDRVIDQYSIYAPSIKNGDFYRLITGIFLHANLLHLCLNCYSLYVIGTQLEGFLGKIKYLMVYLFSGLVGSLFSMIFLKDFMSVGASGAIFGLMGSLVYFGYHYRVYLGNVIKSQIVPLIIINLGVGFMLSGIDNAAHIGGLIGGFLITSALGIKYKSTTDEKANGFVISAIFLVFLIYMAFFYNV